MDQIAEIKQNLDIVNVIGTYVSLKKSGKNYKGLCPFHSEKTPSFMVSPELQIYRCFGCGEAGDIFQFIQKIEGIDFRAALEQLAEKAGVKLEKSIPDPDATLKKTVLAINELTAKFYHYLLVKHESGKPGLDYLKGKRKLVDGTIKDFRLGYAPERPKVLIDFLIKQGYEMKDLVAAGVAGVREDKSYGDKFYGRIMFPLAGIDGKVLGFAGRTISDREPKYLNTSETPVYHKSAFVYALDKAKVFIKKEGAVFVEGYMDVISAHEAGINNVVASSGTSLTTGQLKLISRYSNDLVFCFDSDVAGVAASFRGIELAESMGFDLKVAVLPVGSKDIDEVVKKSPEQAKDIFKSAVPAYDFLLYSIIKRHDKNSPEGKKKIMDELLPWFSKLSNKVLKDHYSKQISKELDINEETVFSLLEGHKVASTTAPEQEPQASNTQLSKQSVESYIISLLFKGNLDFMKSMGYKLDPQDFVNEQDRVLIVSLQDYLNGDRKKFDPKKFIKTLSEPQDRLFESLYLQEADEGLDPIHLEREFESALSRLKKDSAKRQMQKLSEEMKIAEKSGDTKTVKALTAKFEQLKNILM